MPGISKDPKKRRAQLSNLRPDAATKHGVYSEAKLAPLRERFAAELAEQFGIVASRDEIALLADRRAKLEVLNDWLGRGGLLADKRSGRPRAVVQLADRLQTAYERQFAELRRRGGGHDVSPPVAQIKLTDDERVGLMATDEKIRADTAHRILTRIHREHHEEWLLTPDAASHREWLRERAASGEPLSERTRLDLKVLSDADLDKAREVAELVERVGGS